MPTLASLRCVLDNCFPELGRSELPAHKQTVVLCILRATSGEDVVLAHVPPLQAGGGKGGDRMVRDSCPENQSLLRHFSRYFMRWPGMPRSLKRADRSFPFRSDRQFRKGEPDLTPPCLAVPNKLQAFHHQGSEQVGQQDARE